MSKLLKLLMQGMVIMTIGLSLGCSTNIDNYKNTTPKLNLKAYLNGDIEGSGIIQDWKGQVTKQFNFKATGSWQGDVGTLDETMTYYDGKVDHRIWTIKKINDHYYEGKTADVIGVAKIYIEGNAMNWQYQMYVTVDQSTYKITFDDWMYLMKNNLLINKNQFTKFGINVGSLTLFMHKKDQKNANGKINENNHTKL